ncbi:hypothetical protein [Halorhabdus sp. CUG00001]|uniref:hypothetical protein n=1 Tax=Halorhabdus sp. CUG00001 TaxID=2600297 RepID=UPI00131EA7A8|nr:hypothetical protein [Halorhabdus sp. CUG00001]
MNRDELLDQLSQDILAYVMHGTFPEQHIAQEIAPSELEERFHDYEMLVRLHFILRPDVVDFVAELPARLRRVKTQTENVARVNQGSIDGKINWSATYRERHSRNPGDTSIFVCENRTENYDIDENLVLKRLLAIIHETLEECEQYLERDYAWINERWKGEADLVETLREAVQRNVHLTRIRRPEAYEPTDRMLQRAQESRQEVYREAARLLSRYRQTLAGEATAITELLDSTAIAPDDDETLFELFVLFRYISVIEGLTDDRFELQTIETGSQQVARLEADNQAIAVYHDSAARAQDLEFVSDIREKEPISLSRTERIQYETERVSDEYFLDSESRHHTGRPDVIVLEIESGDTVEYLITEVKYSNRQETVEQGIKETLEYLAFLRDDGELVHDETQMFGDGWNGVLVTRDIDSEPTAPIEKQRLIKILQASELESQLPKIVTRLLDAQDKNLSNTVN